MTLRNLLFLVSGWFTPTTPDPTLPVLPLSSRMRTQQLQQQEAAKRVLVAIKKARNRETLPSAL